MANLFHFMAGPLKMAFSGPFGFGIINMVNFRTFGADFTVMGFEALLWGPSYM